ncbi:facilitated trehalose transporter Tret1-like [Epargyreus clarus]|uniref:facilitated trehalose transporter Tret1-like n=1 Tax=Epargyreus clarus TaxID=520877 RepID=UPI003C2BD2D9
MSMHMCSGVWTLFYLTGLCTGAPTVFIPQIRRENSTDVIDDDLASWLYSISNITALPWLLIIPFLTQYFGRKPLYTLACISILAVFIIMFFSGRAHQILYANIIQGFANASNVTIMVLIVIEYSSPKYRGVLSNITTANFYWGMWTSNAIGTFFYWKYIAVLGIISSIYTFSVLFYPESPYWLASKGRHKECKASFRWLHGSTEESERELRELMKSQVSTSWSFNELKSKKFYMPLLLSILIGAQCNFSGKLVCSAYAIDLISKMTQSESAAYYGMLILDGVTVFGMYFGAYLSNFLKRRTILFTSSFISCSFLLIISLYLYLVKLSFLTENNIICVVLLVIYSFSVSSGSIIISLSIYGEIIPLRFQTISFTITSFIYISVSSILLKSAPVLFKAMSLHGSFLFFGLTFGACAMMLYCWLPETKDKTLLEIEEYFEEKNNTGVNKELVGKT